MIELILNNIKTADQFINGYGKTIEKKISQMSDADFKKMSDFFDKIKTQENTRRKI